MGALARLPSELLRWLFTWREILAGTRDKPDKYSGSWVITALKGDNFVWRYQVIKKYCQLLLKDRYRALENGVQSRLL